VEVKEFLEQLKANGLGLYEAMDKLDILAARHGSVGALYYPVLCDVYANWEYREKPKRKYRPTSKLSSEEWQVLQAKYDYRCFYCGKQVQRLTKDHIMPIAQNGVDTIDNIVPACKHCNSKKGTHLVQVQVRLL